MKLVLFGTTSVFLGDKAADTLIDYAAHVVRVRTGDRVELRGYSHDGMLVTVSLLLAPGVVLVATSTDLPFPDRDNEEAIAYMRSRMEAFDFSSHQFVELASEG